MSDIAHTLIIPRLRVMEEKYGIKFTKEAMALTRSIGFQESRFSVRDQIVSGKKPGDIGPATGFWQFELGGGVKGVMGHPSTKVIAEKCCAEFGVPFVRDAVWRSFTKPEFDGLACSFARLLLLSDPDPLPAAVPGMVEAAWRYYLDTWRPGKPHRSTWDQFWNMSCAVDPASPDVVVV